MPRAGAGRESELRAARELYETTRDICARLDLEQALQAIVERANALLEGDVAYLATCDDEELLLRMRASDNVRTKAFRNLVIPYSIGLGGAVAAQRVALTVADYHSDRRFEHATDVDDAAAGEGLRSCVAAPVQFESELLAVLFVAKRSPHEFSDHQVTLLSSLANAAAIAINNARLYGRLLTSMSMQQRLLGAAVAGAGSAAVVAVLADLLQSSVALLDWQHRVLAHSRKPGSKLRLLDGSAPGDVETSPARPIVVGGTVEGYLVAAPRRANADLDELAIEQAATVLTLELAKDKLADDVALRLRGGLLTELQHYSPAEDGRLRRQAAQLGCDLDHELVVVALQLHDQSSSHADALTGAPSRLRLLQIVRSEAEQAGMSLLMSERSDGLTVLLRCGDAEQINAVLSRIFAQSNRANLPTVLVGASRVVEALDELPLAFAEASRAVEVARRSPTVSLVVHFSQLGFHDLLMGAQVPADLSAHAERVLRPLLDQDQARGAELVPTLRSFLLHVGNAEAVARELNVHPNTVRGRLAKISILLGCDLNSAEVRVDLHLALEAIRPRTTAVRR